MAKILLIIMSEEEEKIKMPLNFIKNQSEKGNEIRVVFWGSSEKTLANNQALQESFRSLGQIGPKACVNTAKANGIADQLSKKFELVPVGGYIAESIEEGYVTITF
ncbi:MAG: DsrE family protein [Thermoplasmatales archaeon]